MISESMNSGVFPSQLKNCSVDTADHCFAVNFVPRQMLGGAYVGEGLRKGYRRGPHILRLMGCERPVRASWALEH